MRVVLDVQDLVKYPFLKESQQYIGTFANPLDRFLTTEPGKRALRSGLRRVLAAAGLPGHSDEESLADPLNIRMGIAGYGIARVIVSCIADRSLTERLTRYEAQRAYQFLLDEDEGKKEFLARSIGFECRDGSIPLTSYIEIAAGMRDPRWRLINRQVDGGKVSIAPEETDELMRERIRVVVSFPLPLRVPDDVCALIRDTTEQVRTAHRQRMMEQFGTVDEGAFPPCIRSLISALASGANLPHTGRFALTAFLHNIGMGADEIIGLYSTAPDFDEGRTIYQVEHILGRGGTEYTSPACAALRTTGLCAHRDRDCAMVSHPLTYYRNKKRSAAGGGGRPVDPDAKPAERDDKDRQGGKVRDSAGQHERKDNKEKDKDDETGDTGVQV
jgi:DNA primase large subunit